MTKIVINPKYQPLEEFIKELPLIFNESGDVTYFARNTIKIFDVGEYTINVKSFKKPIFINQIAYVTVRSSKAKRSYLNAQKLIEMGFNTPNPIAYIEEKSHKILTNSYYICVHEEFDGMLREIQTGTIESHKELIRQFALFIADLHEKQILHLDFSPGNILYKLKDGVYTFYLVDLNRMSFNKPIDLDTACSNFRRLWGSDDMIRYMVEVYAEIRNLNKKVCIEKVFKYRKEFWNAFTKRHPSESPYIS
ncbi:MAG: lipopolysaccharide kinase InaA family protein [Prevotella sp.]|jgi:RIO-like serine/threonine protein kinase|nr:lipopolysaccharide kinase InaA family protein [Prevotella sp.]